jgi:hypothetical protein
MITSGEYHPRPSGIRIPVNGDPFIRFVRVFKTPLMEHAVLYVTMTTETALNIKCSFQTLARAKQPQRMDIQEPDYMKKYGSGFRARRGTAKKRSIHGSM